MTKTLTTEAMQEIYEAAVHLEAVGDDPDAEFDLYCKLDDVGGVEATIRKLIDMVRAANREAQPVAVPEYLTYLREPIISNVLADDDNSPMANAARILAREVNFWRSQPLFTAPPAPAVPDIGSTAVNDAAWKLHDTLTEHGPLNGRQFNNLKGCLYEALKIVMNAPPAPVVNTEFTGATAVPDGYCIMPLTLTAANGAKGALSGEFKVSRTVRCHECGGEGCMDCNDRGEFEEEITVPWSTIKEIYRAAVDACRAAMLAQPVSQSYKLVPVEPTPKQWAAGVMAIDAGMDKVTLVYKAMLAAAPEGGNG